jgi:hypothetical protein
VECSIRVRYYEVDYIGERKKCEYISNPEYVHPRPDYDHLIGGIALCFACRGADGSSNWVKWPQADVVLGVRPVAFRTAGRSRGGTITVTSDKLLSIWGGI